MGMRNVIENLRNSSHGGQDRNKFEEDLIIFQQKLLIVFQSKEMRDKIGLLTIKNSKIYFDNCVVPKKNLLGIKGKSLNIDKSA